MEVDRRTQERHQANQFLTIDSGMRVLREVAMREIVEEVLGAKEGVVAAAHEDSPMGEQVRYY